MPSIQTLPKDTQDELNRIVAKAIGGSDLLPEEVGFLRARRDYLNIDQKERFADILEEQTADKKEKTLDEMTKPELVEVLTDLELKPEDYKNKAEMIEAIKEAQKAE